MELFSIYLEGFKALALSEIKSFHFKPNEKTQTIIGTNGSGKTSIMREMNPNPASRADYESGGKKISVWHHENETYTLSSSFEKGNTHSFIRHSDNKELNPSSTSGVQKELVESIFNYTDLTHKVLTGAIKFNVLGPGQRKELLMSISPSDLSYATGLHDKVKVEARDSLGVEKHLTAKVSDAKINLHSLEISNDIEQQLSTIESGINVLLPYVSDDYVSVSELERRINVILERLESCKFEWKNFSPGYVPNETIKNIQDLQRHLGFLNGRISSCNDNIKKLGDDFLELADAENCLIDGELSEEELKVRITTIEHELSSTDDSFDNLANSSLTEQDFITVKQLHEDILDRYEFTNHYSEEDYDFNMSTVNDNASRLNRLEYAMSELLNKKKHHETELDGEITCPKCVHKFNLNGSDPATEIRIIDERILAGKAMIYEGKRLQEKVKEEVACILAYRKVHVSLLNIRRKHIGLGRFWSDAGSIGDMIESGSGPSVLCGTWIKGLANAKARVNYKAELEHAQRALNSYSLIGGDLTNSREKLELVIESEQILKTDLLHELDSCIGIDRAFNKYNDNINRTEVLLKDLESNFKNLCDSTLIEEAAQRRSKLYDRLTGIKSLVNTKRSLEEQITSSERELEYISDRRELTLLLAGELSPNTGIIADDMLGFIESYTTEMNNVIDKMWTYPLAVGACNMDNGKLDYKFPLYVNNKSNVEITKASDGQAQVINLAFTMVMRAYLKLEDYPLYLDEVGSGFDPVHTNALVKFIKSTLETKQCSQILMISHDISMHGGLSNRETLVIDERNVVLPSVYNTQVEIVR